MMKCNSAPKWHSALMTLYTDTCIYLIAFAYYFYSNHQAIIRIRLRIAYIWKKLNLLFGACCGTSTSEIIFYSNKDASKQKV
jgi:hypothetical protein